MAVRHGGWVAAVLAAGIGCTGALGATPLKLAVVGDSDSHAYHDSTRFTGKDGRRGGDFHDTTWQWTEWLHRLRGGDVDQGPWGRYGSRRIVALLQEAVGLPGRIPEKEDFAYNFAVSGAVCSDLMDEQKQMPRLVRLMDESPQAWRGGVVVVRIGVNSFGQTDSLERLVAGNAAAAGVVGEIDRCIADVRDAVGYLHRHHPATRVVLVGIFNNANVGDNIQRWQSPREQALIARALDRYDDALKSMADADPRIAFFNDRAWFAALWGNRTAEGRPAYRPISVDGRLVVTNTQGDAPCHAVLVDGHAGTVWNALWAKALVHVLNQRFGAGIPPITRAELAPSGNFPKRPGKEFCAAP